MPTPTVTVRFVYSPGEYELLREYAEKASVSVSEYIRQAIEARIDLDRKK
jgi:hypothetical protein